MEATKFLVLSIHIQGSFKKCSLLFGQSKIVFVVVWLLNHFSFISTPFVNDVWIITFANHPHVWLTKFKPSLMFLQLPVLTSNNAVWVSLSAVLFDKTQHIVKTSTAGYVTVCYEVINLFIKPQNLLLMGLVFFFICKLKGLPLVVTVL